MDKILNLTYASSLTNISEINSSFDTGVLRICYTGENRNGTYISKDVITKCIKSIYNCPIVCNYDRETDTMGGHDMEIVRDSNGTFQIINATTPVGVIPESANVWFDNFEEEDGTVHEYLYADVLLWKRQEPYKKIKRDGITSHSMEIKVTSGESVDGVYHIHNFEFNAFALIGEVPCFEGSALEMYSHEAFKSELAEMMKDLKETLLTVNTSNEDDTLHYQKLSMEGGEAVLEEKLSLVAKYGIDVDTLDFSIEDYTIEELTEKFDAMVAESDTEEQEEQNFALNSNVVEELQRKLREFTFTDMWGDEVPRYWFADCDLETNEIFCWDRQDWLLYGFTFNMDGDAVSIDTETKTRKKYAIVDFEGEEQPSPFAATFGAMEEKLTELSDVNEKYTEAVGKIESIEAEAEELRKYRDENEAAKFAEAKEAVFAQFSELDGIEEYEALRENSSELSLEELEEKCFAIRGRNITELKFTLQEKNPKLKVPNPEVNDEPYGGIVEKYSNGSY